MWGSNVSTVMGARDGKRGHILAARNARVLYVPSTKVASSTMRLLLAEANGTYRPDLIPWLDGPTVSIDQSVHNMQINGLVHMELLSGAEQTEMKSSADWWRVAAVRNPYARIYSAWENRILLRAPGRVTERAWVECADVIVDGCIDLLATYRRFIETLAATPEVFGDDSHFRSQSMHFDLTPISLTHVIRLDHAGELQKFADDLGARVGRAVSPRRLNEGLGIGYREVTDARTAELIRSAFADDFDRFEFADETFPDELGPIVASERETNAIRYARALTERLTQLSTLARYRNTGRHLAAQTLRNLRLRK